MTRNPCRPKQSASKLPPPFSALNDPSRRGRRPDHSPPRSRRRPRRRTITAGTVASPSNPDHAPGAVLPGPSGQGGAALNNPGRRGRRPEHSPPRAPGAVLPGPSGQGEAALNDPSRRGRRPEHSPPRSRRCPRRRTITAGTVASPSNHDPAPYAILPGPSGQGEAALNDPGRRGRRPEHSPPRSRRRPRRRTITAGTVARPSNPDHAPGAVLGAGPLRPVRSLARATTTPLPACPCAFQGRRPRRRHARSPSSCAQSCLLKSQMAGTRKATPNAAITAMLVSIGCRVRSWRIAAGTLSRSATKRRGSIP